MGGMLHRDTRVLRNTRLATFCNQTLGWTRRSCSHHSEVCGLLQSYDTRMVLFQGRNIARKVTLE